MRTDLVDFLACPLCHQRLTVNVVKTDAGEILDGQLICREGGHLFHIKDGMASFQPESLSITRFEEWAQKQENSMPEYFSEEKDSVTRKSSMSWAIARLFGEFWLRDQNHDLVLDIGCGIYSELPYYKKELAEQGRVKRFIGIDPVRFLNDKREYEFIHGYGEYLPFRDALFDTVMLSTSLDHIADPVVVLNECHRVLRPQGQLAIWISLFDAVTQGGASIFLGRLMDSLEKQPNGSKSKPSVALSASLMKFVENMMALKQYEWKDNFHTHRFLAAELDEILSKSKFRVLRKLYINDFSQSVPHCFLLAKPEQSVEQNQNIKN